MLPDGCASTSSTHQINSLVVHMKTPFHRRNDKSYRRLDPIDTVLDPNEVDEDDVRWQQQLSLAVPPQPPRQQAEWTGHTELLERPLLVALRVCK